MVQGIETSRRFVNTWECDENAHLNVQFYYQYFEDAHVHFWFEAGWPAAKELPATQTHLVRFHGELHEGDLTFIRSHLVATDDGFALCHLMYNAETDNLSATCWCPLADKNIAAEIPDAPVLDSPDLARPRSLDLAPIPTVSREAAAQAGFIQTYRAVIKQIDCDWRGNATTRSLTGFQSDAAGHFWSHVGLTQNWLETNNYGRVAMESRISMLTDIQPGTPLLIMTALVGHARKTLTFRHYIFDVASGTQIAVAEITGVAIDLEKRRTVEWPDDIVEIFKSTLSKSFNS